MVFQARSLVSHLVYKSFESIMVLYMEWEKTVDIVANLSERRCCVSDIHSLILGNSQQYFLKPVWIQNEKKTEWIILFDDILRYQSTSESVAFQ